jgi:hypothetical protein
MMNMDGARAGDGMVSPKKKRPEGPTKNEETAGPTEPVFAAEEHKLRIEVPEGWKSVGH